MTARGEETRRHLLDVAEQLYGRRGVAAVSLREIRVAAGARNTAAMQFHFRDRDGLIDALIARHMPRIGAIQAQLYERAAATNSLRDARTLVEVLVRPSAQYLTLGESERSWVKIMADLASLPDLHLKDMAFVTPETGTRAGAALFDILRTAVPPRIARERLIMVAQLSVHASADYARLVDGEDDARQHLKSEAFIENLVDLMTGAALAPMSGATTTTTNRVKRRPNKVDRRPTPP